MKNWYKYLSGILCAAFIAGQGMQVYADGLREPEYAVSTRGSMQELPARSAVLMDAESGQVLYEKDAHKKMPPASLTKIMTMLLVMEALEAGQIHYNDVVTCSAHTAEQGGSEIWIEQGEQFTVEELLKATAVNSANDASMALAEHTGGTEDAFVARMNERAAQLGMRDSCFQNPTGLDEEGHFSSAWDVALMSCELLRHPDILKFSTIWMDTLRDGKTALTNTNRLVRFYDGCTGLKTGTTDGAGSCLSASAKRGELHLLAVSLGSTTSKERFASCQSLLDYGFSAFERFTPRLDPAQLAPIQTENGILSQLSLKFGKIPSLLVPKGRADEIGCTVAIPETVQAPVDTGQTVGRITYTLNGKILADIPVLAEHDVKEMKFRTVLPLLWKALLCS